MEVCEECGAVEQGTKPIIDGILWWKKIVGYACNICGAENTVKSINKDEEDR